jgi:hypothetical protein
MQRMGSINGRVLSSYNKEWELGRLSISVRILLGWVRTRLDSIYPAILVLELAYLGWEMIQLR